MRTKRFIYEAACITKILSEFTMRLLIDDLSELTIKNILLLSFSMTGKIN